MKLMFGAMLSPLLKVISKVIAFYRYSDRVNDAKIKIPVLYPRAYEYLKIQRESGGFSHKFSEYKLLELAEYLFKNNPKVILELGGGGTTPSVLKCLPHYIADHAFLPYRSVDNSIWKGDSFRHHSIFKECSRFK